MELTLSGRMGGPEVGERVHARLVSLRRALKAEFTTLQVPEVATLDLTLFFSGSISSYGGKGEAPGIRYRKAKKEVSMDICFAASDFASGNPGEMMGKLRDRLRQGAQDLAATLSKHAVQVDQAALVGAVEAAFRHPDLQ
jgi:Immunity protein 12